MAEGALFSLAGKLLIDLASSGFEKVYQRVKSIRKAKKDLDELAPTIRTIKEVLLDAEKQQEETAQVREWIQRVRDVLYGADDLFDDVATDTLLMQQQTQEKTMLSKVRAPFSSSKCDAIISDDKIAKRVRAIRKRLDDISKDMAQFNFEKSLPETQRSGLGEREKTSFVDENVVIGRETEMDDILKFLFDKSDVEQNASVIAIVGIGGMGKTTLAQLIYNHEKVQGKFEKKWWACISDIKGEMNVLEKIARSIDKNLPQGSDPKKLVRSSVSTGSNYLLVLDDVWDNDLGIWLDIISLLRRGAKGSKIIVTTRFQSVPTTLVRDKCPIYELKGLSEEKSWELFKRIALTEEQENDPMWTVLGRVIMKKCANVPLAIKCIASFLKEKNTFQEWESFKDRDLSKIKISGSESIMPTLKLSYDLLPQNLKPCFAHCSLFPEDHKFEKEYLISQWIALGYVKPNDNETFEDAGHSYFMELFRKSFFQEAKKDGNGDIKSCKMHDLIHELAKKVAGEETLTLTTGWDQFSRNAQARHLHVWWRALDSRNIPQSLPDTNRLRSIFFKPRLNDWDIDDSEKISKLPVFCLNHPPSPLSDIELILDGLFTKLKLLRFLDLSYIWLEDVPCSIGGLNHLRYLNLSKNSLTSIPDSLGKLVNLLTLDASVNTSLTCIPDSLGKLVKLRTLHLSVCRLTSIPDSLGKLVNLRTLHLNSCCRLTSIPYSLGNLVNLLILDLGLNYKLTSIPDSLGNLVNLRTLHLNSCRLTFIPDSLGNLVNLLDLDLSYNELTSIPNFLGKFVNLRTLKLSRNELTSISDPLGNLVNLRTLHLHQCGLTSIPDSLGKLVNLHTLHLSRNELTSLPDFIGNLVNLRTLDLSENELTSIPDSLGKLVNLLYIGLSKNDELTCIPDSLTKLVNLLTLDISECPQLGVFPNDLRKLINLEDFNNLGSFRGKRGDFIHMPAGLEELTRLESIGEFTVGNSCQLDVLARLRVKGKLEIVFDRKIQEWDENERVQLPGTLWEVAVVYYPGRRMRHWKWDTMLVSITIKCSSTVEHLPPFRSLPYLESLALWELGRLEYVEEEEDENDEGSGQCRLLSPGKSTTFFHRLKCLSLYGLESLKGWSKEIRVNSRA